MAIRHSLLILLLALMTGCASGASPEDSDGSGDAGDTGGRVDTDMPDATADTEPDSSPDAADATSDVEPDSTVDTAPDSEPDVAPDIPPMPDVSECDVVFDECEPRTAACAEDGSSIVICDSCGQILREDTCMVEEICDESTGVPTCRDCEPGECEAPVTCEPGTTICGDYQTRQLCEDDGNLGPTFACPSGGRCVDGACGSVGGQTGETCIENRDSVDGCRGMLCVCGSEYRSANGEGDCTAVDGLISSGYCTTRNCSDNYCDPGSELCADFSHTGAYGGDSFCVLQGGCSERGGSCGRLGRMQCEELPARVAPGADLTWELGCWLPTQVPISATCTNDSDCIGGECLTENVGGENLRYCSSPCGEGLGCPSYAECVLFPETEDRWVCMARGDSESCPRLSTEMFNVEVRNFPRFGSSTTAAVCYIRND